MCSSDLTDRPRPAVPNFTSRTCTCTLSSDCVTALKTLSQRAGTTLFMTLLAAFKLLLHRYSAQADIGVGVPVANRHHPEVEPLIRSEEHTSELQSPVPISYAVFCLKKKKKQ